jgi:hypothetical protein
MSKPRQRRLLLPHAPGRRELRPTSTYRPKRPESGAKGKTMRNGSPAKVVNPSREVGVLGRRMVTSQS